MPPSLLPFLLLACSDAPDVDPPVRSPDMPAPPVVHGVTLSPAAPTTDALITATADWTAEDPDAATLTWAWTVDGLLVSSAGPTLDGTLFEKGQQVALTLTVSDAGGSATGSSAAVEVVGTPPTAPVVAIEPDPAVDPDDLRCVLREQATEPDREPITYRTSWQVDGMDHPGEEVPHTDTLAGETWTCTVVATDPDGDSPPATASVVVAACDGLGPPARITDAREGFTLASADIDGDGLDDLVAGAGDAVFWVASLGGGAFGTRQVLDTAATGVSDVAAADIDGDGDTDVAATAADADRVVWYEQRPTGWTRHVLTSKADFARGLALSDVDADGDIDVLYAAEMSDEVGWVENLGQGQFAPSRPIGATDSPHAVGTTDVDGDGDPDIVVGAFAGNPALVWFERGDGGRYAEAQPLTDQITYVVHMALGDLDGDGDDDIAAAALLEDRIAWVPNSVGPTWGAPITLTTEATTAHAVAIADFDGDGDLDVASAARDASEVAWFENLGQGTFGDAIVLSGPATVAPLSVAAGDLDGDGDVDLAVITEQTEELSWFENACR